MPGLIPIIFENPFSYANIRPVVLVMEIIQVNFREGYPIKAHHGHPSHDDQKV